MTDEAKAQALREALQGVKEGDQIVIEFGARDTGPEYTPVTVEGVDPLYIHTFFGDYLRTTGECFYGKSALAPEVDQIATVQDGDRVRLLRPDDLNTLRAQRNEAARIRERRADIAFRMNHASGYLKDHHIDAIESILTEALREKIADLQAAAE